MKLARTLQLPTGMAMTFVCSPSRPDSDPAQNAAVTDLFPQLEPRDAMDAEPSSAEPSSS
jgi:hypothetical protein